MKTLDDIISRLKLEMPMLNIESMKDKIALYVNDSQDNFAREVVKSSPFRLLKTAAFEYKGVAVPLADLQFEHINRVRLNGQNLEPASDRSFAECNVHTYSIERNAGLKTLVLHPELEPGKLRLTYFKTLKPIAGTEPMEYDEIFLYLVLWTKARLLADDGFPQAEFWMGAANQELASVLESFIYVADSSVNNLASQDDLEIWEDMT
jgi:hypothetical protein